MKSRKFLILILVTGASIVLASISFHIARRAYREMQRVGTMGTIPSILAFVCDMNEEQLQAIDISLSDEWILLSASQYDAVIEAHRKTGRLEIFF